MSLAVGIDIGGTGIKGAVVDSETGELQSERFKLETPRGGKPDDIADVVGEVYAELNQPGPVGICLPSVVKNGVSKSAANISKEWIDYPAKDKFEQHLQTPVVVVNDADAAGLAEVRFGAGRNKPGVIIMTTLGTGIGSAMFIDGRLVPNTELGHIEIGGKDYEKVASYRAKEKYQLSYDRWAKRLQRYYEELEKLFSPDLFIVGGGVSKNHDLFLHKIAIKTEIVPAEFRNNAGIIGAAEQAYEMS